MEKQYFFLTLFFIGFISIFFLSAQEQFLPIGESKIYPDGKINNYSAGESELTNTVQWLEARKIVAQRKMDYSKNGWINHTKSHPVFSLPVHVKDAFTDPGFFTITAYFDHDSLFPDHLLDYSCGNITYDGTTGYNHEGTDFFPYPFPWYKMANNEVEVVAAAPGILLLKQDGNFDQHCEENNEAWNGLCILHEDGSTSWYVHLKMNSLTPKFVGEEIAQGEYLGIVGSSGSSIAPHLHFEVYDSEDRIIDPFFSNCNETTSESWWETQLPYKEAGVNKISTNSHLPVFPDCPEAEILNETDVFYPGDSIFLMSYFRNLSAGDQLFISINRPDNSIFASWIWTNPSEFYTASWVFFLMFLNDDNYGTWNYSLTYKGITYHHPFQLKASQGTDFHYEKSNLKIYPMPGSDFVTVELDEAIGRSAKYMLLDAYGNQLTDVLTLVERQQSFRIDLSHYSSGIYILRLNSESGSFYTKILKN